MRTTTRELLITAGERLFAERGIEAVSLREIAQAAGQRNNTALQYHFGSRAGLLDAIHSLRSDALNRRRLQLLSSLDEHPTVEDLVGVMIRPYAETVTEPGNHYVGLLSRLLSERGAIGNVASPTAVAGHLAARDRVGEQLVALQPGVAPEVVARRFDQILAWAIVAFAALAPSSGRSRVEGAARLLSDLVPMLSAALTAPAPVRDRKTT